MVGFGKPGRPTKEQQVLGDLIQKSANSMASRGSKKKKKPMVNHCRQDEVDDNEDGVRVAGNNDDFQDNTQDGNDPATVRAPGTWPEGFFTLTQQMALQNQQMTQFMQMQTQQLPAQAQPHAPAQVQPQQGGGPAQGQGQSPLGPPSSWPSNQWLHHQTFQST